MTTPTTRQSAIEALDVLLTSSNPADTLRVSQTGRVYEAHPVTVLFERVGNAGCRVFNIHTRPTDREGAAREAVRMVLTRDLTLLHRSFSDSDAGRLDELLKNISKPTQQAAHLPWQTRLSNEIDRLRTQNNRPALAFALEKLEFYGRRVNAPLFRHMREHLAKSGDLAGSLKIGIQAHLMAGLGLSEKTARNASMNIHWAMQNFGCNFQEALDVACCAGRLVRQKECGNQAPIALSIALLRVRHGVSLDQAKDILNDLAQTKKPLGQLRIELEVMGTYGLPLERATDIADLSSQYQLSTEVAVLASLSTWPEGVEKPTAKGRWKIDPKTDVDALVDARIAELLPAGWPDQWELMPDGSRQPMDMQAFTDEFMNSLKAGYTEGKINPVHQLASTFVTDAGRMDLRFGTGRKAEMVHRNAKQTMKALAKFIPDQQVRTSLSRCLFQGGPHALLSALSLAFARPGKNWFAIESLDPDDESAYSIPSKWISVQPTEEGTVRVGYGIYMKHFALRDPENGDHLKINSSYTSSMPPTSSDHTAMAIGLVEFDMEDLRKGIIEPALVRSPVLRLTIEPDRRRIMETMAKTLLTQQRSTVHQANLRERQDQRLAHE